MGSREIAAVLQLQKLAVSDTSSLHQIFSDLQEGQLTWKKGEHLMYIHEFEPTTYLVCSPKKVWFCTAHCGANWSAPY